MKYRQGDRFSDQAEKRAQGKDYENKHEVYLQKESIPYVKKRVSGASSRFPFIIGELDFIIKEDGFIKNCEIKSTRCHDLVDEMKGGKHEQTVFQIWAQRQIYSFSKSVLAIYTHELGARFSEFIRHIVDASSWGNHIDESILINNYVQWLSSRMNGKLTNKDHEVLKTFFHWKKDQKDQPLQKVSNTHISEIRFRVMNEKQKDLRSLSVYQQFLNFYSKKLGLKKKFSPYIYQFDEYGIETRKKRRNRIRRGY